MRLGAQSSLRQRKSRLIGDQAAFHLVPRRGLEPPRSYPLVPETSASTNSATWAGTFLTWLRCRRRVENVNIAFIWRLCPMSAAWRHDVSFVQQRRQVHGPCRQGCMVYSVTVYSMLRWPLAHHSSQNAIDVLRNCVSGVVCRCICSAQRKSRLTRGQAAFQLVPRRGLEPPRSYPLVPETSASTNSATWAGTFYAVVATTNMLLRHQRRIQF